MFSALHKASPEQARRTRSVINITSIPKRPKKSPRVFQRASSFSSCCQMIIISRGRILRSANSYMVFVLPRRPEIASFRFRLSLLNVLFFFFLRLLSSRSTSFQSFFTFSLVSFFFLVEAPFKLVGLSNDSTSFP